MNEANAWLKPKYSLTQIFFMNVTTCIGAGIFVLSAGIHGYLKPHGIGGWVPWAFALGALPAMLSTWLVGLCSALWPSCGGDYTYYKNKLHPLVGFTVVWCYLIAVPFQLQGTALAASQLLASAASLLGYTQLAAKLQHHGLTVSLLFLIVGFAINLLGWEGKVARWNASIALVLGLLFVGVAFGADTSSVISQVGSVETVFLPSPDLLGFVMGTAIIMFAYGGVTYGQSAGEECTGNYSKGIIKVMLLSVGVVTVFYLAISFALYHGIPWEQIAAQSMTHPDLSALQVIASLIPKGFLGIMELLLMFVLWDNMYIIGFRASRQGFALARDGYLPGFLKGCTLGGPAAMTIVLYLFAMVVLLLFRDATLAFIANYGFSLGLLLTGVIAFRLTPEEGATVQPFLAKRGYLLKVIGVIVSFFYTFTLLGIIAALPRMAMTWLILGLSGGFLYWRKEQKNQTSLSI